ncbi:tol-pal system YbgF family protein [Desulfoluna sp.]|uniref:tetratricopeptide repeat protein n=1 Tax=Desulfoluna sp. TaxID=2045199 RepID=UPI0026289BA4|nr:tetratricopeptide repeat protein [Desulfoluna sp.]
MTTYCIHHPHEPAHWACPSCGGDFCNACVKTSTQRRNTVDRQTQFCPRCNRPMTWVGAKNAIVPYWERLPQFFLYPLTWPILGFLGLLGSLNFFVDPRGIPGIIIELLSYALILRYAYLSLVTTTRGDLSPPPMGGMPLGSSVIIVMKQTLLVFLLALPYSLALKYLGQTLAYGVLFLLILCLPAMVILLVTSNRVFRALNPNAFIRLAFRIGKGYLGMFGLLIILWGAPTLVVNRMVPLFSPHVLGFLTCVISGYYTLVSYHLMGYVTLQYHEKIGYDVEIEHFSAARPATGPAQPPQPEDPHLKQVTFLLKEGQLEEALTYLRDMKKGEKNLPTPALSDKYFALLQMLGPAEEMVAHGHAHLKGLITRDKKEEALSAYTACVEADPEFIPSAHTLYHVGLWTSDKRSPEKAIAILQRAVKHHPQDPMIPTIWFRAARILNDRLHQHEKATKLLQGLLKQFPEHEIIPQVKNYLSVI